MQLDLSIAYIIVQVIFLEGILSIDNAAVLGAMVSVLPKDKAVPWPGPLAFLGNPVQRLLGGQRTAALKVGLLGAYLGRGLMLVVANFVIHNPFLKILGAAYLIKLAFENLGEPEPGEETQTKAKSVEGKGFWGVVLAVELADLAFSLDNVVAVVALSDNLYIVMFGVAIGIITMRFAAGIFTLMIMKEPILKPAAYIVVFNIGAELLLDEFAHIQFGSALKFMISAGTLILAVVYAHIKPLHVFQPVLTWLGQGMADVNELLDWALKPVWLVFKIFFRLIGFVLRPLGVFTHESGDLSQESRVALDSDCDKEKEVGGKQ
ncbi:MAG TPA: tellurium resistance protein TerC [Thermodesulfobacteriota bacterium]|nr:tellurium resistance protein TerC [Thermodesulfobacteriota bacterium]